MARRPRIAVESYPYNPPTRTFHTNARVTNTAYREHDGRPDAVLPCEPLSEAGASLVNDLHAIDGVLNVGLDVYRVQVTIGPAFDWDELTPQLVDVLRAHLGWSEDVEVVTYSPPEPPRERSTFFGIPLV